MIFMQVLQMDDRHLYFINSIYFELNNNKAISESGSIAEKNSTEY